MSRLAFLVSSNLPSESEAAQIKSSVTYTLPSSPENGNSPSENLSRDDEFRTRQGIMNERMITLLESRSLIAAAGSTGQRTWEAALHLGAYLVAQDDKSIGIRTDIKGKHVVELGAGTGLISILCAKFLDARRVTATDGDENVVEALRTNSFLNGVDEDGSFAGKKEKCNNYAPKTTDPSSLNVGQVHANILRWGHSIDGTALADILEEDPPDILLAADVVSYAELHYTVACGPSRLLIESRCT